MVTTIATAHFEFTAPMAEVSDVLIKSVVYNIIEANSAYAGSKAVKDALAATLTVITYADNVNDSFGKMDFKAFLRSGSQVTAGYRFKVAITESFMAFTSKSGHIGTGSRNLRVGDKVCILRAEDDAYVTS